MINKVILNTIFLLLYSVSFGQDYAEYSRSLQTVSSDSGNFIYMWNDGELRDSNLYRNTKHFVVARISLSNLEASSKNGVVDSTKKPKKIGITATPKSDKEILQYFPNTSAQDIYDYLGFKVDAKLNKLFSERVDVSRYQGLYQLMETRLVIGDVYLDKKVTSGEKYVYFVTRIDLKGKSQPWGIGHCLTGSGNYWIKHLKPTLKETKSLDSLVVMSWQIPIPMDFPKDIDVPGNDSSKMDADMWRAYHELPFPANSLHARLYELNDTGIFVFQEKILGRQSENGDTLFFDYGKSLEKEDDLICYIILEDETYNMGIESDTAYLMAITKKDLPFILTARSVAVEDGIQVSWDELPPKPYISGIQVIRSYGTGPTIDTFPLFPPYDTSFVDFDIVAGQTYDYAITTSFKSVIPYIQDVAATTQNVNKVFSAPIPPFDLTAEAIGAHIQLNWETVKENSTYGFYIYRGEDEDERYLIDGPIFESTYLDTAKYLSSTSQYFYSIVSMNLRQDTSVHSNIAIASPDKAVEMYAPSNIDFYQANDELHISWHDVRIENNFVEGYVVERRIDKNGEFNSISDSGIFTTTIIDSIQFGHTYEYRIAPVDMYGNQGPYGKVVSYEIPNMVPVGYIDGLIVRNIQTGILITLPNIEYSNHKEYTVYRRQASQDEHIVIGKIPSGKVNFLDPNVVEGTTYVYSVTITQTDGQIGPRGKSVSRKRTKPSMDDKNE